MSCPDHLDTTPPPAGAPDAEAGAFTMEEMKRLTMAAEYLEANINLSGPSIIRRAITVICEQERAHLALVAERDALKTELISAYDGSQLHHSRTVVAEAERDALRKAMVRARNDLREALEMNSGFTTPEGKVKYTREAMEKLVEALAASAQPADAEGLGDTEMHRRLVENDWVRGEDTR